MKKPDFDEMLQIYWERVAAIKGALDNLYFAAECFASINQACQETTGILRSMSPGGERRSLAAPITSLH